MAKFNFFRSPWAWAALAFVVWSNSSGPSAGLGNVTGASGSSCIGCHGGTSFGTITPSVEILDANGQAAINYEAGQTYRLTVAINNSSGSPAGFGFQMVAWNSSNQDAGSFSNPTTDVRVNTVQGRQYVEHNRRSSNNTFSFDWTAPAANTGRVRFFVAGIAANGNNSSSGDGAGTSSFDLEESGNPSTSLQQNNSLALSIFPNPSSELIHVRGLAQGAYIKIYDTQGRLFWEGRTQTETWTHNIQAWPAGYYVLHSQDAVRSFIKR